MPVFHCYRGDVNNIAIEKPNSFALTDDKGSKWICHEEEGAEIDPGLDDVLDFWMAQGTAHQQGLSAKGSSLVSVVCERHELPTKLPALDLGDQ